ncbi:hypothetical protein EJ02DRAFT_514957 [Clathrospora elynae]|uniref:Uncharacterized protein n=1 Tax=Clathrospora elynae TaxID=706981 RepID=A0A6A5SDX0_9PLEO|nr:hypothetical protein EJ02DRAFT_514957 [Clathrospora elynae]
MSFNTPNSSQGSFSRSFASQESPLDCLNMENNILFDNNSVLSELNSEQAPVPTEWQQANNSSVEVVPDNPVSFQSPFNYTFVRGLGHPRAELAGHIRRLEIELVVPETLEWIRFKSPEKLYLTSSSDAEEALYFNMWRLLLQPTNNNIVAERDSGVDGIIYDHSA